MNIHRREFGGAVVVDRSGNIVGVDFELLLQRILLNDAFVLRTARFKEITYLVSAVGVDETISLLTNGLIEICCEVFQPGSRDDQNYRGVSSHRFEILWVDNHDYWEKYVDDCLAVVREELGLVDEDWRRLELAIRTNTRRLSREQKQEIAKSFHSVLNANPGVVRESIRLAAKRRRLPLVLPPFEVSVTPEGDLLKVETDLRYTKLRRVELWEIQRDGLLGAGNQEVSLGLMQGFAALAEYRPEELPLFEARLNFAARSVLTESDRRIGRVKSIAGLPRFDMLSSSFSVDKILTLKDSEELRAFRDWLAESDRWSDSEIRNMLRSVRARLAPISKVGSATMVRFMIETSLGIIYPVAGLMLSAFDTFVMDKILKVKGPAAFINRTYPSLFRKPPKTE